MRPEAGKVVAGRYRLERPLASGGMGAVWVARHLQLDVPVAVKFMFDELRASRSGSARFLREAKAAARLRSPHVARAYDYDLEDGTPYIAMELLDGESLEARLARLGTLSLAQTAAIVRQVARALHEAHELGIVHRDLKPANIFMARVGDEEIVKLLDFGIAKDTKDELADDTTASGAVVGSPYHMSPEQVRGGAIDARSDLWSLAVVAFRCLTGHRPFTGNSMGDVFVSICADAIPPPSSFVSSLGPSVDGFFERGLARNPAVRFGSAREMADRFDALAAGAADEPSVPLPVDSGSGPRAPRPRTEPTVDGFAPPLSTDGSPPSLETTLADAVTANPKRSPSRRLAPAALVVTFAVATAYVVVQRTGSPGSMPTSEEASAQAMAAPSPAGTEAPVVTPDVTAAGPATVEEPATSAPSPSAASSVVAPVRGRRGAPPGPSSAAKVGRSGSKDATAPAAKGSSAPRDKFF